MGQNPRTQRTNNRRKRKHGLASLKYRKKKRTKKEDGNNTYKKCPTCPQMFLTESAKSEHREIKNTCKKQWAKDKPNRYKCAKKERRVPERKHRQNTINISIGGNNKHLNRLYNLENGGK